SRPATVTPACGVVARRSGRGAGLMPRAARMRAFRSGGGGTSIWLPWLLTSPACTRARQLAHRLLMSSLLQHVAPLAPVTTYLMAFSPFFSEVLKDPRALRRALINT